MERFTQEEMEAAQQAIAAMIGKVEQTKAKFAPGTSQHTLQKNRLNALYIAESLIAKELSGGVAAEHYTQEDLQKAAAPVASLISKSEKAKAKLAQGTWQHTMLCNNLKALHIASPLLAKALSAAQEAE